MYTLCLTQQVKPLIEFFYPLNLNLNTSIMKKKSLFSWPEKIVGYLLLGYLGYVLVCMILGTFDII